MENQKYIIQISFNSIEEVEIFARRYKQSKENLKPIGNEAINELNKVEKRGSKTKEMHQKVKEYIKTHPEETYRNVLKKVKQI